MNIYDMPKSYDEMLMWLMLYHQCKIWEQADAGVFRCWCGCSLPVEG